MKPRTSTQKISKGSKPEAAEAKRSPTFKHPEGLHVQSSVLVILSASGSWAKNYYSTDIGTQKGTGRRGLRESLGWSALEARRQPRRSKKNASRGTPYVQGRPSLNILELFPKPHIFHASHAVTVPTTETKTRSLRTGVTPPCRVYTTRWHAKITYSFCPDCPGCCTPSGRT